MQNSRRMGKRGTSDNEIYRYSEKNGGRKNEQKKGIIIGFN